jgi:predicted aspartyl protease
MYSKKTDSMTIPISVYMWHKKTETEALLDSGATHNFIDERAVKTLGLGTRPLKQPLHVSNVDGTLN